MTPLIEDDKGKTKVANVIMLGRKEFIKVEKGENMKLVATIKYGDTNTIDIKCD